MQGLETVYKEHHKKRGEGFAILQEVRGAFLRKHVGTEKEVLDIGCRDGQLTSAYSEGNNVTGVDVDQSALERANKNHGIKIVHADLNADWVFDDGKKYDAVVSCEFLEHIYFPETVMEKIKNLLKEDGVFVGTVPHAFAMQSRVKYLLGRKDGTPLQDPTHINQFTHQEFKSMLERHFEIIEFTGNVPPRYKMLAKLFPLAFADIIMFAAKKK